MPKISEETRLRRIERVLMLIRRNEGIREKEISVELGIERKSVNNYLHELSDQGKIYKEGLNWHAQEHVANWLRRFELPAEEAFTLYLAARLFVKQSDKRNEPAVAALSRLAEVLKNDIPVSREIFDVAQRLGKHDVVPSYETHFRTVIRAYLQRRPLKIRYRTLNDYEFETIFHIYLIEPSAIGHATYLVGHSSHVDALRVYKLERVISAEPDNNSHYDIPDTFPGLSILDSSWSIIVGSTTTKVVLRFSQQVKKRVLETRWHPSQDFAEQPDGSLLWWVEVTDTRDLFPWIRSWGGDVEIIEPTLLREQMKGHVAQLATHYAVGQSADDQLRRLLLPWGKTTASARVYHPALFHMIDVANVAWWLLSTHASPRWRSVLGHTLNAEGSQLQEWLPFLISLHDIGKISVTHQAKNDDQIERLKGEGFEFGAYQAARHRELHHTIMGMLHLTESAFLHSLPRPLARALLAMVGGHHGRYQEAVRFEGMFHTLHEPEEWRDLRDQGMGVLEKLFLAIRPKSLPEPNNVSAAIATLTGFTILCDWLGSDKRFFPARPHMTLLDYMAHSRQQAYERVGDAGFFQEVASAAPITSKALFNFDPRPLQLAVDAIPSELLRTPTLTIIEAPTGEGKTEAALALAHHIGYLRGSDELYIALPTTATSNAMFQRVQHFLVENLNLPNLAKLVHGQDYVEVDLRLAFDALHDDAYAGDPPALEWFRPKKQALLAPFGVGTIDQAELTALNVKHNALRMMGLAGKTIILDEVHAYDTYMMTIIERMLTWLSQIGTSVILLSATLPLNKRHALASAFASERHLPPFSDAYPALITIGEGAPYVVSPAAAQAERIIGLETLHLGDDHHKKAQWLLDQSADGGCICWITNLVENAQKMFAALRQIVPDDVDCTLLHARMPLATRQVHEKAILRKYGPESAEAERPARGIVIGTQVLEQSLDLDFDVMVSDLAPIDLLFQRAGRLHRHIGRTNRGSAHPSPLLYVHALLADDGDLRMGHDSFYGEYILSLTWQQIVKRVKADAPLSLPSDYRQLVEAVYSDEAPEKNDPLFAAWSALVADRYKLEQKAQGYLINEPHPRSPYSSGAALTFREDEDSNAWMAVQTRYSERPSLTVIPLERIDETTCQLPDGTMIATDTPADRPTEIKLMMQQLRLSSLSLVPVLLAAEAQRPALFTQSSLLKQCHPIWLSAGANTVLSLRLDPDLGLVELNNINE